MADETSRREFDDDVLVHLDAVFRVARRLARDDSEAEDLVQETFIRAFRAFERFEMRDHGVKPWLFKILHNVFYTHRRKVGKQPTQPGDEVLDRMASPPVRDGGAPSGIDEIDWDAIDDELKRAVDDLPAEYRMVLLLWSFCEMSYKEIAEVCDCAVGTVMSRLYRARRQLEAKLAVFARAENVPRKT